MVEQTDLLEATNIGCNGATDTERISFDEFHLSPRALLCSAGERLMLRSDFSLYSFGTVARSSGELDLHFLKVI